MKRFVIIGLKGSGKTTLANFIEGNNLTKKTGASVFYRDKTIEVPGAYVECGWMSNFIIMISQNQGKANLFLLDGENLKTYYSPNYASGFSKKSLAIITKSDLMTEESRKKALDIMNELACEKVIFVSFKTGEGLNELTGWLEGVEETG